MKKILALTVAFILLFTAFYVSGSGLASVTAENVAVNSNGIQNGDKKVDVKITVDNNPGIIGAIISVKYESAYFELVSVDSNGIMSKASFDSKVISKASPAKSPYILAWSGDTLPKNIKDNGVLCTLTFAVKGNTPDGVYPIELSYDYENYGIVNYNIQSVKFETVNGSITVGKDAVAATPAPTSNATAVPTEKPTPTPEIIDDEFDYDYLVPDENSVAAVENLNIAGASLDITSGLDMCFKASKTLFDEEKGYSDPYIICTFDGRKTKISDYEEKGNYLVFTFEGITPDKMGEPITATLHGTMDEIDCAGATIKYSVKEYCYTMLEKHSDDAQLCTLMTDILNYGAAVQEYSEFNADNLVNADLTDKQKQFATSTVPETANVLDTEVEKCENEHSQIAGAGIVLKNKIFLRYLVKTDNPNGLYANVFFDDKALRIDSVTKCPSGYYIYVPIDLTDIFKEMTVKVMYKDQAESNTVKYSVTSYINAMNSEDEKLQNVFNTLMKYYSSASEYLK